MALESPEFINVSNKLNSVNFCIPFFLVFSLLSPEILHEQHISRPLVTMFIILYDNVSNNLKIM